jgi:hypothetical protein
MKPFKMFFGLSVAVILFLFVARIAIAAFIIAGILSIGYAIFRRIKDFITYDRYGNHYIPAYHYTRYNNQRNNNVEPLFEGSSIGRRQGVKNIKFIETI